MSKFFDVFARILQRILSVIGYELVLSGTHGGISKGDVPFYRAMEGWLFWRGSLDD